MGCEQDRDILDQPIHDSATAAIATIIATGKACEPGRKIECK